MFQLQSVLNADLDMFLSPPSVSELTNKVAPGLIAH